jgi:hypothetical protein
MRQITLLRKDWILWLFPVLALCSLAGCTKPVIAFDSSFPSAITTNIIAIDTMTVATSTVLVDSFATAGSGASLVGNYFDPYFGSIRSQSFLQIGPPVSIPTISFLATFDSLSVMFRLNRYFYGDTTIPQTYHVSQLDTLISLPIDQYTFYNTDSFLYNPTPLGSTTVTILPTAGLTTQNAFDTVKVRLPDAMGEQMLGMLERRSDTVSTLNGFLSYFKGLALYADNSGAGVMYGLRDTCTVRLWYHEPSSINLPQYIDFKFSNKAHQFNQISANKSGTPISILTTLQSTRPNPLVYAEAPSSQTGNACYVQSGTGIEAKIAFPYIGNITNLKDYVSVYQALLILKPVPGSYNPLYALPPQLILSQTDENNKAGAQIIGQTGALVTDYVTGENTAYSYNITTYVKNLIASGQFNQSALLLSAPSPASITTMNRAIFANQTNQNYTITLNLYYVSLPH